MVILGGMLALASWVALDYAVAARQRAARAGYEVQAQAMASSGLQYAEAMVRHGRWQESTTYTSPAFSQEERFRVTARQVGGGWELDSVGQVGDVTHRERKRF